MLYCIVMPTTEKVGRVPFSTTHRPLSSNHPPKSILTRDSIRDLVSIIDVIAKDGWLGLEIIPIEDLHSYYHSTDGYFNPSKYWIIYTVEQGKILYIWKEYTSAYFVDRLDPKLTKFSTLVDAQLYVKNQLHYLNKTNEFFVVECTEDTEKCIAIYPPTNLEVYAYRLSIAHYEPKSRVGSYFSHNEYAFFTSQETLEYRPSPWETLDKTYPSLNEAMRDYRLILNVIKKEIQDSSNKTLCLDIIKRDNKDTYSITATLGDPLETTKTPFTDTPIKTISSNSTLEDRSCTITTNVSNLATNLEVVVDQDKVIEKAEDMLHKAGVYVDIKSKFKPLARWAVGRHVFLKKNPKINGNIVDIEDSSSPILYYVDTGSVATTRSYEEDELIDNYDHELLPNQERRGFFKKLWFRGLFWIGVVIVGALMGYGVGSILDDFGYKLPSTEDIELETEYFKLW